MEYFYLCLLLCGFLTFANTQKEVANFKGDYLKELSGENNLDQCGNQILRDSLGRVEYKVDEELEANERCVWLIRVENASSYSLAVFSLGFPESNVDHKLSITTFTKYGLAERNIINNTGVYNFNGPILIVALHTGISGNGSNNVTGFLLSYDTHFDDGALVSTNADIFLDATSEGKVYLEAQVGLIPTSINFALYTWGWANGSSFHPENRIKIAFGTSRGWSSSNYVDVYLYDPEASWQYYKSYHNYYEFEVLEAKDLVLIVARSSSTTTNTFFYHLANFFWKDGEIE